MKLKGKTDWILATGASGGVLFETATGRAEVVESIRTADLAASVAAILKAHPLPRKASVLVLGDSIFHQNVQLPRVQTNGLTDEELASVIFFEIEPFSSLSAEKGLCAFVSQPGEGPMGSWDVIQVDKAVLADLAGVLRAAGCVLAGVSATPSGVTPSDVASSAKALEELSRQMSGGTSSFAVALPPQKSLLQANPLTVGGIAVVAVMLFCAVDYAFQTRAVRRLRPEVSVLTAKAAENASLSSKADEFNRKAQAVEKERDARKEAARKLREVRGAMGGFLFALAESCGDDAVLMSLERGERALSCKVVCQAATAEGAATFLNRLSGLMTETGWRIAPVSLSKGTRETMLFSFTADYSPEQARKEGK